MVVNCFVVVFVNTYLLAVWLFQSALVVYLQAISNSNVVAHPMFSSSLEYYKSCVP